MLGFVLLSEHGRLALLGYLSLQQNNNFDVERLGEEIEVSKLFGSEGRVSRNGMSPKQYFVTYAEATSRPSSQQRKKKPPTRGG